MKQLLITIDGPAGAGKTTVSRLLARRLGYTYVDTGALYRAIALGALSKGVAADDDRGLKEVCKSANLSFHIAGNGERLHMNGEDVSDEIRTQEISMAASAISARPVVRQYLLDIQRAMGDKGGAVFEGRDMGTVVFPSADIKFFLIADVAARGMRRHKELLAKGTDIALEDVTQAIIRRDRDDSSRSLAPLKAADDAIVVDSTSMQVEKVVETMLSHIEAIRK